MSQLASLRRYYRSEAQSSTFARPPTKPARKSGSARHRSISTGLAGREMTSQFDDDSMKGYY